MNRRLSFIFGVLWFVAASTLFAEPLSYSLSVPDEMHAVPTISRSALAVARGVDGVYIVPKEANEIVRIPFRPVGKTRVDRFGDYVDSTRIPIPKTQFPGLWRGITFHEKRRQLWDGSMLQTVLVDESGKNLIQESSVAADTLKPAADRMGEPTNAETTRSRAAFNKARHSVFGLKYTGIAPLPEGWFPKGKSYQMIATRIPGFPVVVMGCQADDPMACKMERQCFTDGAVTIKPADVSGIGVLSSEKLVAIGDAGQHAIHLYKFHSCMSMSLVKVLKLPKEIKKLTNLSIDSDENLWVTTAEWDNKFDSDLYYWEKSQWNAYH